MNKATALAVALVVSSLSLSTRAAAEPLSPLRFNSPVTCTTKGGSTVELPEGVYLTDRLWVKLDTETRRLQELETRLSAENESLKRSLETPRGTITVLTSVLVGIGVGVMVF